MDLFLILNVDSWLKKRAGGGRGVVSWHMWWCSHVWLLWEQGEESVHVPTPSCPLPLSVCLRCLYNEPLRPLSLTHVSDGSEGWGPCVFFSSYILTLLRSSLPFPSLLLCCSHSFGGATLKGSYGQPCLTRKRPGPNLVSVILGQTGVQPTQQRVLRRRGREDDDERENVWRRPLNIFEMSLGWFCCRKENGKISATGRMNKCYTVLPTLQCRNLCPPTGWDK